MTFIVKAEAKLQAVEERKQILIKKYRDVRSQLIAAKKEAESAAKKAEGLTSALAKIEKEAEEELGEEW